MRAGLRSSDEADFIGFPLFGVRAVVMAKVKYDVGFLQAELGGLPVPYTLWTPSQQRIIPFDLWATAISATLETIVHAQGAWT